ncbi:unnamed protein product [Trichogramma brassicae]|uniref:DDE Tnp4 domain-containing protein n=1 Tax=Trichogramma brassicae TaxID=86971 RepID=A0A6H5IVW0_9HYME|nr:unnamed protein product [Trichogramma brassicae]
MSFTIFNFKKSMCALYVKHTVYIVRKQWPVRDSIHGEMRVKSLKSRRINDISDLTDHQACAFTSLTKEQFDDMHALCDRIPDRRAITRRDLLIFLTKMRQGLSDEFLTAIFQLSSRQYTSLVIKEVRKSLMRRFVSENIGLRAITREQYMERHVTAFANHLYNPRPEEPVAIFYIDGTYKYCFKSTNFRSLRQTYCRHKGDHLVKPALVVAPDGYILDISRTITMLQCSDMNSKTMKI